MALLTLGINHQTAPVEIRERLTFAPGRTPEALRALTRLPGVTEGVIVSTCNRTELYCTVEDGHDAGIVEWLLTYHAADDPDLRSRLYSHLDDHAVRHLLRVACGLDSMVLGETQILGQLKESFEQACANSAVGPQLNRLFQRCFSVAKHVRTDTAIGANPVSVASAAVSLARQVFGGLEQRTALLIGAGETIELVVRHLRSQGLGRLVIANRSLDRAHELAVRHDGYAIALDELGAHLHEADLVIASTAAPEPILLEHTMRDALARRRGGPVLIVDLAVPRDVEASIARLPDVFLYSIDDLRGIIDDNRRARSRAADDAQQIIDAEVTLYAADLKALDAVPAIRALRSHGDEVRRRVLAEAQHMLESGRSAPEVLEWLAHTLANRLLHAPSANLKELAKDDARAIRTVQRLFGLED